MVSLLVGRLVDFDELRARLGVLEDIRNADRATRERFAVSYEAPSVTGARRRQLAGKLQRSLARGNRYPGIERTLAGKQE